MMMNEVLKAAATLLGMSAVVMMFGANEYMRVKLGLKNGCCYHVGSYYTCYLAVGGNGYKEIKKKKRSYRIICCPQLILFDDYIKRSWEDKEHE